MKLSEETTRALLLDALGASNLAGNKDCPPAKKQIVVLQRGWVVVGDVAKHGQELVISNASVIRAWGTTKGLGELRSGPLPKTKLDPAGTVRAHELAVVLTIDCEGNGWD